VVREESAEAVVDDLVNGAQKALVLRAFVLLGVAEHVPAGGAALAELSVALKAPVSSVSRLMRAVVGLGLCDQAMTSGADGRARDLLDALDWSSVGLVVDVGGGQGRLLARVLGEHPHLRGVVVDRLEVVAAPAAETRQVADRLDMAGGDFFATVPAGADVYVLSRIVHDWPDRDAIAILRTCREAMTPGSRLCLLEQVAPNATEASGEDRVALALKDLNMLVLVGGQERTLAEYQELLDAAGLSLARVHEGATCSVLEAATRD
jgi:SAM-dependent methyltransferase